MRSRPDPVVKSGEAPGTARPKPPGLLGRARTQALGVVAVAISVAVVLLLVLIGPTQSSPARSDDPHRVPSTTLGKTKTASTSVSPVLTLPTTTSASAGDPTSGGAVRDNDGSSGAQRTSVHGTNAQGTKQPLGQQVVVPQSPPSSTPATTTTTSSTTTTTSPPPTYVPPHVGSQSWPGNLDDPYTSASYQLTTTGGEVSATASWAGTPTLSLALTCSGAAQSQTGASGLYVSVDAPAGSCTVTLAEPSGTEATVSYTLTADYPTQPT